MRIFDENETKKKIELFGDRMLQRMVEHKDRGDWTEKAILSFYTRIAQITVEVFEAIEAHDFPKVAGLSVDGANYYMMLSDRIGGLVG